MGIVHFSLLPLFKSRRQTYTHLVKKTVIMFLWWAGLWQLVQQLTRLVVIGHHKNVTGTALYDTSDNRGVRTSQWYFMLLICVICPRWLICWVLLALGSWVTHVLEDVAYVYSPLFFVSKS